MWGWTSKSSAQEARDGALRPGGSAQEAVRSNATSSQAGKTQSPSKQPEGAAAPWQNACFRKYRMQKCNLSSCPYRHDLTTEEIKQYEQWQKEGNHIVYHSDESSDSFVGSNGSDASEKSDEKPADKPSEPDSAEYESISTTVDKFHERSAEIPSNSRGSSAIGVDGHGARRDSEEVPRGMAKGSLAQALVNAGLARVDRPEGHGFRSDVRKELQNKQHKAALARERGPTREHMLVEAGVLPPQNWEQLEQLEKWKLGLGEDSDSRDEDYNSDSFQSFPSHSQDVDLENPPSKGSLLHADGSCRPCIFSSSPVGCKDGENCKFCHYEHHTTWRKPKWRPCKGKRERYRKLLSRLVKEAEANPETVNVEDMELPPSVSANDFLRKKLMLRVSQAAEDARSRSASSVSGSLSSSFSFEGSAELGDGTGSACSSDLRDDMEALMRARRNICTSAPREAPIEDSHSQSRKHYQDFLEATLPRANDEFVISL